MKTKFKNACILWYVTLISTEGILEFTKKKVFALGKYILINAIANKKRGKNLVNKFSLSMKSFSGALTQVLPGALTTPITIYINKVVSF